MAIDPRITSGIRVPDAGNVIAKFNQNMQNNAEQKRIAELHPLRVQQAEQAIESNQQGIDQNRAIQRIQNIHQTGQRLKPIIESGDIATATKFMLDHVSSLQGRIEAGEKIDITESLETLQNLQAGNSKQVLQDINSVEGIVNQQSGQGQASTQFGGQKTFKDSKGNLFFGTTKRNPNTGEVQSVLSAVNGSNSQPEGQVSLVTSAGETAGERDESKINVAQQTQDIKTSGEGKTSAIKEGVKQAVKAFEKMPVVRTAIGNYDDAMTALDNGAETGTITRLFPSIKTAGKALDNTIKRLGLDVVGNTTFGALSESELAFALQAAIPDNMNPVDLKKWLSAKKNVQQKILAGLDEVSTFLGDGTKTITDWKNKQTIDKFASEQDDNQPAPTPAPTQRTGGVIMTDAQGNRATVYPDGTFEEL